LFFSSGLHHGIADFNRRQQQSPDSAKFLKQFPVKGFTKPVNGIANSSM
jgi:hypothetical protein